MRTIYIAAISVSFCFLLASCATTRYEYHESYPKAAGKEAPKEIPKEAAIESKTIVASWYGTDFHGKPTSSGEPFNMYSNTCAHKEYPFGTRLKVTNLANSKSTECIVNDRGPFVAGRDLDLSYACAKEIGLIGTGTGKVNIDYLGRDTKYVKEVRYSPVSSRGPYTIQVGSYKELHNATRMKTALEFKYSKVYVFAAEVNDATYYRVRIGKFTNKNDAATIAKTLADEGYSILITQYDERI